MIKKSFTWLLTLLPVLGACSMDPSGLDEAEDQIISFTTKDPNTTFSQFTTFAIVDSIYVVKDKKSDSYREKNATTDMVLKQIADNMKASGYQQLSDQSSNPDLFVDVSYLQVTNTSILYPGYWWYWWDYDWWWDGWIPYYPYPYPYLVSSYTVGTMTIETAALKNVDPDGKVPVVWTGAIRGILYTQRPQSEVQAAIDECFTQLPPK